MKKVLLFLFTFTSIILSQSAQTSNPDQYMFLKKSLNSDTSKTSFNRALINADQYIFMKGVLPSNTFSREVNPDQYIFSGSAFKSERAGKFDPSKVNSDQYFFMRSVSNALMKTSKPSPVELNKTVLSSGGLSAKPAAANKQINPPTVTSTQDVAVLKYDNGVYSNRIGSTGSATYEASARFTQSIVSPYVGWYLTKLEIYIADAPLSTKVKIYDAGTSTSPGTLLYSQDFTAVPNSWNTINLTTPVSIANKDIWVGYEVSLSANYPMGADSGPSNSDGNWIYLSGAWHHLSEFTSNGSPMDYNWLIHATLESSASNSIQLTYNQIDASALPTIKSYVTVTDNNGVSITGLTSSNFVVQENGTTRTPITVTPVGSTGTAISVALVIDRSGSMSGTPLTDAKTAANSFVDNMQSNDKGAVISFDNTITVNQGFTNDKTVLKTAINNLVSGNTTAIYDAVYQAVDLTKVQTGRKAIILMTDGGDNASTHSITDAINYAIQNSLPVYTIGLGLSAGSTAEQNLQQIASQTGGKYYLAPNSSQLSSIYQSISQQLNNQYLITYTTPIQCGSADVNVNIAVTYNSMTHNQTKQYTPPACNNLILTYNQIDVSSCPTVKSYVTVTDLNGTPITGLTNSNFTVTEDNLTQSPITVTSAGSSGTAISVALVIDKSGSMTTGSRLTDAKTAANSFVDNMQTNDRGAVISFNTSVTVDQGFTSNKTNLKTAISNISAGGNTAIYDAIYQSVDLTKVEPGRKAIILMTDGGDNSSSHSITDAINYAIQNSIPVYTIGLGITAGSSSEQNLQQIATQTGGKYYLAPGSSDLLSIYQSISQQLNNQYVVTYNTSSTSSSARNVSITVTYNSATDTKAKTYTSTCSTSSNLILTYNQIDASSCPFVKSYVTVTDLNGVPIAGLTSSNFTVLEDNITQSPVTVTTAGSTGSAISVALVIDRSGSMSGTPLSDAKTAANSFVDNMQSNDKGAVISFDNTITVNQGFTTDKTVLKTAINNLVSGSTTAIYDAIYQAVDLTKVETGRKAIILMTDGGDNASSHSMTDAINYAVQNSLPVYTIGLGLTAGSTAEQNLQQIASQTGGKYYLAPSSSQLQSIYQSISQQLSNQYVITYSSSSISTTVRTVSITATYSGSSQTKTKTYTSTCSTHGNLILTYNQIDASTCPSVKSYVTVTDLNGVTISGLTSSNFTVTEDYVNQSVSVTTAGSSGTNIAVGLVIDKSGSMAGASLSDAKTAANTFVDNLQTNDKGAIISFNTSVTVDQGFTSDKTLLKNAVNGILAGGNTAIYDAIYQAVDLTKVQTGRKAIILMTDGGDNSSSHSMTDAINYAVQNSLPVYTIGLGLTAGSTSEQNLQQIATQTGGKYYLAPNSSQLLTVYQSISQQLSNQYIITFNSTSKSTLTRTITIAVTYGGNLDTKSKTYVSSCVSDVEDMTKMPTKYELAQNYPNPFNPSTKIRYSVPQTSHVTLTLYDVLGNQIKVLVDTEKSLGNYEVVLDGSNMASGVYFVRMMSGNFSSTKKITLMK
ncbi:MAG: VWA domain-containing protein [Bacteroidetes bacterium]|nr:VWA domain-containing protein [Bacteroidota bacterium]